MSTTPPPEGQPRGPVHAQVVREPFHPYQEPRSGWGRWLLVALLLLLLAGSVLLNLLLLAALSVQSLDGDSKIREEFFSHSKTANNKVVILSVEGLITEDDKFVERQLERAKKDGNVKAIVLRVNSPGGTVAGSDLIYHRLRELRRKSKIPIVVSMGGMAASGGYYVSMAVGDAPDTIYAEPTTWTGSIGVIIPHYDLVELLDKVGVKDDSVMSHPLKDMLSPTKPMTEEEKAILQSLVDETFARFKEVVQSGRPKFKEKPEALKDLATGRVFTANQALEAGLVDRIGFLDEAVARAVTLTGLGANNVKVVQYKREPGFADLLIGTSSSGAAAVDLDTLLEMTAPRAYYLCTWLPSAARHPGRRKP